MFEHEQVEAECPTCNRRVTFTIGQAQRNETIACVCGQQIVLNGEATKEQLKPLEEAIADLKKKVPWIK
jgi:hypothetical protein